MHTLMTHKQHAQVMVLFAALHNNSKDASLHSRCLKYFQIQLILENNFVPDVLQFFWLTATAKKKRRAPVENLIMLEQCHCKGVFGRSVLLSLGSIKHDDDLSCAWMQIHMQIHILASCGGLKGMSSNRVPKLHQ